MWYNVEYGYDLNNNISRLVYRMPQRGVINKYTYGKDNLLTKYDINDARGVTYTYDGLNRLTKTSISTDRAVDTTYEYYASNRGSGYTTTKLKKETIDGETYYYTYDTLGNITEIDSSVRGALYSYEYDAMNQLTRIDDHKNSKMYFYGYDTGGNLTVEGISNIGSNGAAVNTQYKRYEYGDSNWTDKLTKYNGQEITYDAIGNPLTYRDGMTMTWKNGRQLDTLSDGTNNVSYSYDSSSVRISKTVNGVKHTYAYLNGMLMYETRGEAKFYYSYDANGTLYSVKYTLTDSSNLLTYYYTHNSRGDIVGIYNGAGQFRAHYEYDAWGNVLSVTDENGNAITSATHIGNLNPFRYRGYYYDTESGFYYLMSRYYDPVIHRFVNADGYFQSGGEVLDANMSAYCRNNPILFVDPTGQKCSKHDPYYVPNCFHCSEDYRKFVNDSTEWYNRTSGDNIAGVNFDGTVYYNEELEIDFTSTESKVLRTVGVFIESFGISGDVGIGIGTESKGIVNISAISKTSLKAGIYGNAGFDIETYTGNDFSVGVSNEFSIWDFEMASSKSVLSNATNADVGSDGVISFGSSKYFLVGCSFEISFNYEYFGSKFRELWW